MFPSRWAFAIVIAIVLAVALPVVAQSPKLYNSNSVVYGKTYSQWSAAWWQWAFSIPVASHPLFDNADCSIGQSGPVWFLGGQFCQNNQVCNPKPVRACTVPYGKLLYFPVVNIEDSAPEEPNWGCGNSMPPLVPGTIAEMRQCLAPYIDGTRNLVAEVDGVAISGLKTHFRVQSLQFDVTMPDDNFLNAIGEGPFPAGTYSPVVDDGVYVMLAPLTVGNHTLKIKGMWANGGTQNITYNLNVVK